MPKNNPYSNDRHSNWKRHNNLPVAIRKGTTDDLRAQCQVLLMQTEVERSLINRTHKEAKEKAADSEYWIYFKDEYHYSTLDGRSPFSAEHAKKTMIKLLMNNTVDFAVQMITVFYDGQWRPFKEVYQQL